MSKPMEKRIRFYKPATANYLSEGEARQVQEAAVYERDEMPMISKTRVPPQISKGHSVV